MAKKSRITTPGVITPPATQADRLASRRDDRSRGRQAAAEARRRQKRIQRIALGALAVLLLAAGAFYVIREVTRDEPGESASDLGGGHVDETITVSDYNTNPPTSGQHWARTETWGVHTEPVPNELQVHNLEHGGVIIQYNSSVTEEEINQLEQVVGRCNVKLMLAPRPDMEDRVSVTAWTWIMGLDSVDTKQINDFISAHVNNGPEDLPTESQLLDRCNL